MICLTPVVNTSTEISMPRSYNLGRREAPKANTRARIIEAAIGVYRERGLAGASNLAVARAADVAPATIRNHFPDPEDLARAVFTAMLAELNVPTPAIFDGLDGLDGRVERLARELAAFYERSQRCGGCTSASRN
jgi:AcrR family transcriptional regulator